MPILLDFESRSRADLKRVGGRNYWADPSTEALCCVLHDTDTGERGRWLPGDPCPVSPGDVLGAHNAQGFDRFAADREWGWPLEGWIDTSELARKAGLPGALDALGSRWLGLEKDKAASRFTTGLSTVRKPKGFDGARWKSLPASVKRRLGTLPPVTPEAMDRVVPYCSLDVDIIEHGWPTLEPWLEVDAETSRVERVINDRGVGFDVPLAKALLRCDAENAERALEAAARVCGMSAEDVRKIANSPAQFAEYCHKPDAQKLTVDEILANPGRVGERNPPHVVAMATARRALASIARGKLEAGLDRVSPDGRIRDSHRYYGAHTGRWSGRGMQLQNIPRPAKRFEDWEDAEICRAADAVLAGGDADPELLDVLLRATLVAKPGHTFAVCDFSGVEARALAWAAGDHAAIEVFTSGRDPYKVAAAEIFSCRYEDIGKDERRTTGKMAELACGYQGGTGALERISMAAGVDLAAAGVDPQRIVDGWRKLHAPIVRFWYDCQRAFQRAVEGREASVSCFRFVPAADGSAVAAILPSGRPIVYEAARASREESGFGRARVSLSYLGTKQHREHIYGGKIVENLIQALCRDLLASAMVEAEDGGLSPVLHVHDEIVAEIPREAADEGYSYLHQLMTTLPDWAEGFPIGAAGHVGRRYRK